MKIAIMGAMVEEITPLLNFFAQYEEIKTANNTFYLTKYKNHEIILAYSKIGKVNSSLTASIMIEKFGAQILLFSGVAGAISEDLRIGDLVFATKLVQHDIDITAFGHPFGFLPEGKIFVETNESLCKIAIDVARDKKLNLRGGIIATGDQFVCTDKRKNWIKDTFKADAIEMEGASVAVVCDALNIPFFILRSISDAANMEAGFDFDTFLLSSAHISAGFIISMLDQIK